MKRITPILFALGLACLVGQINEDGDPEGSSFEPGTMVLLALGTCATVLGCANLVKGRT